MLIQTNVQGVLDRSDSCLTTLSPFSDSLVDSVVTVFLIPVSLLIPRTVIGVSYDVIHSIFNTNL